MRKFICQNECWINDQITARHELQQHNWIWKKTSRLSQHGITHMKR